jgi:hypothetical protein
MFISVIAKVGREMKGGAVYEISHYCMGELNTVESKTSKFLGWPILNRITKGRMPDSVCSDANLELSSSAVSVN